MVYFERSEFWHRTGQLFPVAFAMPVPHSPPWLRFQLPLIPSPPRAVYPTWGGCTRSGLSCYSDSSSVTDSEQLFVVSDSPATASTQAP